MNNFKERFTMGLGLVNREEIRPGIQAPTALYGLFSEDRCEYIGKTKRPNRRIWNHRRSFPGLRFEVIGWTTEMQSFVIERELINRLNMAGQAQLNIQFTERSGKVKLSS